MTVFKMSYSHSASYIETIHQAVDAEIMQHLDKMFSLNVAKLHDHIGCCFEIFFPGGIWRHELSRQGRRRGVPVAPEDVLRHRRGG